MPEILLKYISSTQAAVGQSVQVILKVLSDDLQKHQ